jgi:hypothetical protein
MALINDPNITSQIAALANTGTIDTAQLLSLVNSVLPAGQQISSGTGVSTGVYKRFGEFDKVNAKIEVVTTGIWSGDSGSLTNFFTSSVQAVSTSSQYYYNVYDKNPATDTTAEVQFAVAYGHVNGSGSTLLSNDDNSLLATKATYAQYRSLLLDDPTQLFQFENSAGIPSSSNSIYVINVNRARYREQMDAGNWSLTLDGGTSVSFIDNSGQKFGDTLGKAGRVFKVVEGTLNIGTESEASIISESAANGQGFGLFYPDRGIIVLNPSAIASKAGAGLAENLSTGSLQYNHKKLYNAIVAGGDFEARRTENVSTQHFFVRANNREFNYSNNPTYVQSDGSFTEASFETDPQTYITTVGLYNDSNELIAVAKTSQPIVKSFDRETLIKIKLSF